MIFFNFLKSFSQFIFNCKTSIEIAEENLVKNVQDFYDALSAGKIGTKEALHYFLQFIDAIWTHPLLTIEGKALRVSNILMGIIFLIIAFNIAKRIRLLIRRRLSYMNNLQKSARKGIENISYYIILVIISFFALELANVPLTIFTLIGGALAIGIGFGSQNVIQNFISGLILMLEQKIRVGDFIEINGLHGTVVDIGARCTQLISIDNIDIIVPNSKLLDDQIINWSLTEDGIIRVNVEFQLENNIENCDLIEGQIRKVLQNNLDIIQSKGIEVYLNSFAANSLNYQAYFYVDFYGKKSRRRILTDVYKNIGKEFAQYNIKFSNPVNNLGKLMK